MTFRHQPSPHPLIPGPVPGQREIRLRPPKAIGFTRGLRRQSP